MTHRFPVALFAVTIVVGGGSASVADVDATGRWLLRAAPIGEEIVVIEDWTQTGTTLTTSSGFAGTINPATGAYFLSMPSPLGICPDDTRSGNVAADGRTLGGTASQHFPGSPTLCLSGLSYGFTGSLCGGGLLDAGEECDDGNGNDGDGCSASCQVEPCFECSGEPSVCTPAAVGTPCGGAGTCTTSECNAGGDCVSVPNILPCRGAGRSRLLIADDGGDRDKFIWKWTHGFSTSQGEFADPLSTASYELCLYSGTTATLLAIEIPPDAQRWSPISDEGYRYRDAGGEQDGIRKIILQGSNFVRSRIIVKGKGANLPDVHPPLSTPIRVQLRNTDTNVCWAATFRTTNVNASGKFKADAP